MIEDLEKTASRILALVDEWKYVNRVNKVKEAKPVAHWCPPGEGWHKANADGAFSAVDERGWRCDRPRSPWRSYHRS
jgi:hypothetical protein